MQFLKKPNLTVSGTTYSPKPYEKPVICPFCGIGTDGVTVSASSLSYKKDQHIVATSIKCTGCELRFVAIYERKDNELKYIDVYPHPSGEALNPCFEKISPRFVEVHKEAQAAEIQGLTDLAAMGYRKALEIIVKDFAIVELKEDELVVTKKSLEKAIGAYLHQESMLKTADVVRILGNDHVHYKEIYPGFDFSLLKHYYNIFLQLIVTEYEIRHPPVERK